MRKFFVSFFACLFILVPALDASAVDIYAPSLLPHAEIFFSPKNGSFLEGSTFEVPVYINTLGKSVNSIELTVKFDATKLEVVNPSGGKSILGLWVEPPTYNNTRGLAHYIGTIPGGIVTSSGLIATITFKSKNIGPTSVSAIDVTQVLLNDGVGSPAIVDFGRADYTIVPKAPDGPVVFSETHSVSSRWYNNNSPVIAWEKPSAETAGFSYVLDDKPNTIPDNVVTSNDTVKSFEKLSDGLWYFHIKAYGRGVWGSTTHFLVRIDTKPPAAFSPQVEYLTAAVINYRNLVSFYTTDALSGLDHYEVGVIDKTDSTTASPVFIQTESPYQLPTQGSGNLRVIVRAFDGAGNVQEGSVDVTPSFSLLIFSKEHIVNILLIILVILLLLLIIHYFWGHHVIRHVRRILETMRKEDQKLYGQKFEKPVVGPLDRVLPVDQPHQYDQSFKNNLDNINNPNNQNKPNV